MGPALAVGWELCGHLHDVRGYDTEQDIERASHDCHFVKRALEYAIKAPGIICSLIGDCSAQITGSQHGAQLGMELWLEIALLL